MRETPIQYIYTAPPMNRRQPGILPANPPTNSRPPSILSTQATLPPDSEGNVHTQEKETKNMLSF